MAEIKELEAKRAGLDKEIEGYLKELGIVQSEGEILKSQIATSRTVEIMVKQRENIEAQSIEPVAVCDRFTAIGFIKK